MVFLGLTRTLLVVDHDNVNEGNCIEYREGPWSDLEVTLVLESNMRMQYNQGIVGTKMYIIRTANPVWCPTGFYAGLHTVGTHYKKIEIL